MMNGEQATIIDRDSTRLAFPHGNVLQEPESSLQFYDTGLQNTSGFFFKQIAVPS